MTRDEKIEVVEEYFRRVDGHSSGRVTDLFTDDCEVYFPKYGEGQGHGALREMGRGLAEVIASFQHDMSAFKYAVDGDTVTVEGTTFGVTVTGATWRGGETVGGRFCSVFEIQEGRIARMFVYLDPDYVNADAARYPRWQERHRQPGPLTPGREPPPSRPS